jgi:hypothetical protein
MTTDRPWMTGASTALELVGASAVGIGLWLIYRPLAWLWLGALCFLVSLGLERIGPHDSPPRATTPAADGDGPASDAPDAAHSRAQTRRCAEEL